MLVQRLGSSTQKNGEFIDELCKNIAKNKNSCDEVWFATDYGFPPLETHKNTAETISVQAEKFRKIGVEISLQISNTIGHGAYMSQRDCTGLVYDGSPVQGLVGHDGMVAKYCFCPSDRFFIDYTIAYVKEYAKLKPAKIWIDDDLRLTNHAPVNFGCFCDTCIARFNKLYGSSFTREELVNEINFGDIEWRKRYIEFSRKAVHDFTYELSKAVHEISPDTIMCLQYGPCRGFSGPDQKHILDAMLEATGHIPHTRPGGGAYDDYDTNEFFRKSHDLDRQNFGLPEYVEEITPEIENLPDVMYGKTVAGTCFETSLYLAKGSTGMTYAIMMRDNEPSSWQDEMLSEFTNHYDYWKKLADANHGTSQSGIVMALAKNFHLAKAEKLFSWNAEPRETGGLELEKCGIPVAYSHDTTSTYFLNYRCARVMTNEELEALFDKPVITDGETIEMLMQKGYDLGISVEKIDVTKLRTRYCKHECTEAFDKFTWGKPFGTSQAYKLKVDSTAQVLERYSTEVQDENDGEIATAIFTTKSGGKWAVFGDHLWNPIISSSRRQHILNIAEYLNPERMTARLLTPVKSVFLPRENKEHKLTCVSVVNCTVGKTKTLQIEVRNPIGTKAVFMSQYNGTSDVKMVKCGENTYNIEMPGLDAFSVGTIFFE